MNNLEPLEQDRLAGRQCRDPIEPGGVAPGLLLQLCGLGRECCRLIMKWNNAGRAKDRLSQPAHPKQQQKNPDQ